MLLNDCLKTRSHVSRNLLKMMIKFELYGMLGKWDVRNIGSLGCGMFGLWDVRDVECSGCWMFGICYAWDAGCSRCKILRMWDVDLQNAELMLNLKAGQTLFICLGYFFCFIYE